MAGRPGWPGWPGGQAGRVGRAASGLAGPWRWQVLSRAGELRPRQKRSSALPSQSI